MLSYWSLFNEKVLFPERRLVWWPQDRRSRLYLYFLWMVVPSDGVAFDFQAYRFTKCVAPTLGHDLLGMGVHEAFVPPWPMRSVTTRERGTATAHGKHGELELGERKERGAHVKYGEVLDPVMFSKFIFKNCF